MFIKGTVSFAAKIIATINKESLVHSFSSKELESATGVQNLDETVCISYRSNVLGTFKNPTPLSPSSAMDKLSDSLGLHSV